MVNREESEDAFRLLEAEPTTDLLTRETEQVLADGPARHAVDSHGRRHLLLPVPEGTPEREDTKSKGVTLTIWDLGPAGSVGRYVDLRCNDTRLNDLFATVCNEVLEGCATQPNPPEVVASAVLDRWRDLLGPATSRLLSESAVKGLISELHFLEALARFDPNQALGLWVGSEGARHDFVGQGISIEIKASAIPTDLRVHVNGLTQLAEQPGKRLYLIIERLESVPVGGDSIDDVVKRLLAAGLQQDQLLRKLRVRGVPPADLPAYAHSRWQSLDRIGYEVDESFPRLIPSVLSETPARDRIVAVEYVLQLGVRPPEPLSHSALESLPVQLMGGLSG